MQLLVQGRPGDPAKLAELKPMKLRAPQHGELQLEVLAAPIHPVDQLRARGLYPLALPFPAVLGSEGVARVRQVGPGCQTSDHNWKSGDLCSLPLRVGSYRSALNLPARLLIPLDPGIDPRQACMLRIAALSADLLLEQSGLRAGASFFNLPASGAVGQCLMALARLRGIKSINLIRNPAWRPWLQALDPVAKIELFSEFQARPTRARAQIAFDGVGGSLAKCVVSALQDDGHIINYGALSRTAPQLSLHELIFRNIGLRGFWLHRWIAAQEATTIRNRVRALAQLMCEERLKIKIARCFALKDYKLAFQAVKHSQELGRVILCPSEELC